MTEYKLAQICRCHLHLELVLVVTRTKIRRKKYHKKGAKIKTAKINTLSDKLTFRIEKIIYNYGRIGQRYLFKRA